MKYRIVFREAYTRHGKARYSEGYKYVVDIKTGWFWFAEGWFNTEQAALEFILKHNKEQNTLKTYYREFHSNDLKIHEINE